MKQNAACPNREDSVYHTLACRHTFQEYVTSKKRGHFIQVVHPLSTEDHALDRGSGAELSISVILM